jgi:hypothetical protein
VRGLVGTGFSDQEIGQIYAANWERDLSQAHPLLGNTILCWKEVKVAAYRRDAAAFERASRELRTTMGTLTDQVFGGGLLNILGGAMDIKGGKSYGGYGFYHHFDNPTPASLTKDPSAPDGLSTTTAGELRARGTRISSSSRSASRRPACRGSTRGRLRGTTACTRSRTRSAGSSTT